VWCPAMAGISMAAAAAITTAPVIRAILVREPGRRTRGVGGAAGCGGGYDIAPGARVRCWPTPAAPASSRCWLASTVGSLGGGGGHEPGGGGDTLMPVTVSYRSSLLR